MKRLIYLLAALMISQNVLAQSPFITRWKTDNAGSSSSTSITIPTIGSGYNYDVDWNNDGTFEQFGVTGDITHDYGTTGTYTVAIRGAFPGIFFAGLGDKLKFLSIERWGDIAWRSMSRAFDGCANLVLNATDVPNTAAVTDMSFMFRECRSFNQALPNGFNTSAVTNMSYMFKDCSSYNQALPGSFNTSNVTNMNYMFDGCSVFNKALPSSFNTSGVTTMFRMFADCSAYNQALPSSFNTSNVTDMSFMFQFCTAFNQNIGSLNIGKATNMREIFFNSGISRTNYDNILIAWNAAGYTNKNLGIALPLTYCDGQAARSNMITNKGWTIANDTYKCPKPFITRWKTDNTGTSNSTSITIPTTGTGYYYDVDWNNDGTFDDIGVTGNITHNYGTAGTYTVAIRGDFPRIYFNNTGDAPKLLSIEQWGDIAWTSMSRAFYGCANMVLNATDVPNTAAVTDMSFMFYGCSSLNQALPSGFNTSSVTNMSYMFAYCSIFNKALPSSFNTSNVTNMSYMFVDCNAFNQSLASFTLNTNVNLSNFLDNTALSIANYDATLTAFKNRGITGRTMGAAGLKYCAAEADRTTLTSTMGWTITDDGRYCLTDFFITRWDLSKPSGSGLTQISFGVGTTGTVSYTWAEVGGTATGSGTFSGSTATITGLPAGGKIDLSISPTNFNQININGATDRVRLIEIKQWGTTAWANMVTAFYGCFNMTLTATDVPNTSAVTDMSYMFGYCSIFNQALPIGFNTSNVTNMSGMFHSCTAYNQALPASINTSEVTDMSFMFYDCDSYNKALPIGFNTTNVVTMLSMFHGCRSYNQALPTNFNTSAVIDMRFMFNGCASYNQALPNSFNTAKVTGMRNMFNGCTTFNQSLASFTLNPNVDLMNFLNNTALSLTNYDATLTAFRNSGITGRTMGAAGLNYCAAEADRSTLTSTMGWTITDAGKLCPTLTIGTATNPITCSGSDGKIAFTTSSITAGSQTLSYKKDGVTTTANVTIASNAFELTGLGAGTYSDFAIGVVTATGTTTLADPAKPTFTVGTAVKPTTCNATDGSLPLNGLANSTSYSVSYQKDGGAAVVRTLSSNASGVLTISNLGVGSYTNIKVTLNGCESTMATATIAAPTFSMTTGIVTQPTTCGGNGSIQFTTSLPGGTYSITFKKGGVTQTGSVMVSSSIRAASAAITLNSFTLSGISADTYTDFKIVYGGCDVVASGPVTLADPAKPTFTVGTAVKPTTCIATDGSLPLTGLANSTSYSVSYQKDGAAATVSLISSNGSGILTIPNLGVGAYTNIKVTLNNCESATATASIAAPSFNITAGSPTQPSTCSGTGSIPFTTSLPTGTYSITYKKDGTAATASVNVVSGAFNLVSIRAGSYSDFKIVHGGCDVITSGSVTLTDPTAPTAFSVTGGGSFCTGGTGVAVGLSSSQTDVNYQLKLGSDNVGGPVAGSGGAISFGNQTATGTYTVMAIHSATLCSTTMTDNATINTFSLPQASISGNATVCKENTPVSVSFTAMIGPAPYIFSYKINNGATQTLNSSSATANLPQATNVAGVFVYSLVSVQDGNGCSQIQSGSVTVNVLTKPSITLTANGQTLLEGNTQTLCDIDANAVNGLQFTVTTACVAGSPVWRVQVGSGAWSDWTTNPPITQSSNNQAHRYQAACDATCPNTYTSPIELTMNYRASVPQNVSMSADGTTVGVGEEKSICDQSGTGLRFNATCGAGERLLYSVDGGDYLSTVPSQIVDGQFHNYRVRCQKSDGTPSCVETESGAMRLKISVISGPPVASLNVSSGCGIPTNFLGTATCPAGFSTVWYASATNVALPSLPATTPSVTTSYYARCQNEAGCQSGNSNTVTYTVTSVNEAPVVTVSSELVCMGQEVRVSTSCPAGSTVLWNTGVTEHSFKVAFSNVTTQSYTARCVFGNGCQSAVSAAKTVRWKAFELTIINIGQSQSAVKSNDRLAWASQFVTPDGGPILDQSSQSNPTLYYSENLNKTGPRYWTVNVEACALGTGGSLTFDMLVTPETGVPQSFNTHENNAPYFMYANREGWTELYAQNHPAYGFYQDNGAGSNMYNAGLPKGLYKLGVRYWDMKGWGSIYPSTRKPQGNVFAYQEYWFRIQSKEGVGASAARTAASSQQGATTLFADARGVKAIDNVFAQVVPNPVMNTLRLQVQDRKGQAVETILTDASGRTMLHRQFIPETNTHQEEFGVSEWPTGMYFLQVNAGDKQATLKVVKVP